MPPHNVARSVGVGIMCHVRPIWRHVSPTAILAQVSTMVKSKRKFPIDEPGQWVQTVRDRAEDKRSSLVPTDCPSRGPERWMAAKRAATSSGSSGIALNKTQMVKEWETLRYGLSMKPVMLSPASGTMYIIGRPVQAPEWTGNGVTVCHCLGGVCHGHLWRHVPCHPCVHVTLI